MHSHSKIALAGLISLAAAQQIGTNKAEVHPNLQWQTCTGPGRCSTVNGKIVLDSNWRWTHRTSDYTNCYTGNKWDTSICTSNDACAANCAVEGADYSGTYGITTSGNAVTLAYRTNDNIGSRIYLMATDDQYQMFTMNGNEIAFDVENAGLGCGLNGAVYFVSMDADGGKARNPTNKIGAKYGAGYCDSQCPRDLKWIAGKGNVEGWKNIGNDPNSGIGNLGACCAEMDLWEANRESFALTPHPCSTSSYTTCSPSTCGGTYGDDRYAGVCDADGCDLAPFRHGNTGFYGPGKTIDTTKKFTVVTQFSGSGTSLTAIKQYFIQNGKKFTVPGSKYVSDGTQITADYCAAQQTVFKDAKKFSEVGGLSQMGKATGNPMVLTLSIWDDGFANMLWLDGVQYPTSRSASEPGVPRGVCPLTGSEPATVREKFRNAKVTYSNIKFGPIGSTYTI
ncbi:Exoglucanase 1 [Microdochium trichocladiopsis]|uniref:Glucanase n=1 Tax=Microdochium trichocladiopsis TaxID=1682393 RepID=A0A9P9BXA7_9PEZI|nr:Exoglucanase 1 [Microdochium trichocladiopsis]KAH7041400.1 Exoglucanase 1 [Microdochium trichocladiopsis]